MPFSRLCQLLRLLLDSLDSCLMSPFHGLLFSFVMVVYIVAVSLTACAVLPLT